MNGKVELKEKKWMGGGGEQSDKGFWVTRKSG